MAYENHMVSRLRELLKECEVRGYSGKRKAELIAVLQAGNPPTSPHPQTWEPKKPPHPTKPPSPPPPRSKRAPNTKKRIKW